MRQRWAHCEGMRAGQLKKQNYKKAPPQNQTTILIHTLNKMKNRVDRSRDRTYSTATPAASRVT